MFLVSGVRRGAVFNYRRLRFQFVDERLRGGLAVFGGHAFDDLWLHLFEWNGSRCPAANDLGEMESPVAGKDRTGLALVEGENDEVEFLHEFAALEPSEINEFVLLVRMLKGHRLEVRAGFCLGAQAAEEIVDV